MSKTPDQIVIMTDDDVSAFMSEMDWIKQEVDDLQHEILNVETKRDWYKASARNWKDKFADLTNSSIGLQLSEAHSEIDRLKHKNNELINKMKGKP